MKICDSGLDFCDVFVDKFSKYVFSSWHLVILL